MIWSRRGQSRQAPPERWASVIVAENWAPKLITIYYFDKFNQDRVMRMTDHIAQSSLVRSLVARLARDDSGGRARRGMILARFVRDDTAVACKMTRLGVTSPCILALVGALPRVRPFFLFTVAPGLLVRTRGLNNSLKKLEASSTKIFQYFPTDM